MHCICLNRLRSNLCLNELHSSYAELFGLNLNELHNIYTELFGLNEIHSTFCLKGMTFIREERQTYIYEYIYIYTCIHIHIYVCIYIYVHTYIACVCRRGVSGGFPAGLRLAFVSSVRDSLGDGSVSTFFTGG